MGQFALGSYAYIILRCLQNEICKFKKKKNRRVNQRKVVSPIAKKT